MPGNMNPAGHVNPFYDKSYQQLYVALENRVVVIVTKKNFFPDMTFQIHNVHKTTGLPGFRRSRQALFVVVFVEIRNELYQSSAVPFALEFFVCCYVFELAGFAIYRHDNADTFQIIVI
jgi:hypothetical protein